MLSPRIESQLIQLRVGLGAEFLENVVGLLGRLFICRGDDADEIVQLGVEHRAQPQPVKRHLGVGLNQLTFYLAQLLRDLIGPFLNRIRCLLVRRAGPPPSRPSLSPARALGADA